MADRRDEAGFSAFVVAQWSGLVRLAATVTGSVDAGEDAVQTALARVWSRWPGIEPGRELAYARRAVLNETLARRRRRSWHETPVASYPEFPVDDGSTERAEAALMRARLSRLSPRARAIVTLRHVDDLSVAEVAEALGITAGAVKSMNARALAQLREAVEREEA